MLAAIDHIVLTARDLAATVRFYGDILGAPIVRFGDGRFTVQIGEQKINLHQAGAEFEPKAESPTPGSLDICFLTELPLADVIENLSKHGVEIELGPVPRTGAAGPLISIYLRDPDGNLLEIAARG